MKIWRKPKAKESGASVRGTAKDEGRCAESDAGIVSGTRLNLGEEKMIEMNKVYCMSALEFLESIPEDSVDFCYTDPPYNINFTKAGSKIENDKMQENEYITWQTSIFSKVYDILKSDAFLVRDALRPKLVRDIQILEKSKFQYVDILATIMMSSRWQYQFGFDMLFLHICCQKGKPKVRHKNRNVFFCPAKSSFFKALDTSESPIHKAVEMYSYYVSMFTDKGNVVLDPFCGSGTTAIACKILGRNFYACDIDPKMVEITNERLTRTVPLKESTKLEEF